MLKARTAPSVAEMIEIGVPSQVPKSRPEAPASSGPGNSAGVSAALTAMKTKRPRDAVAVDPVLHALRPTACRWRR